MQEERRVVFEAGDELLDVIAKLGVTAVDMRQIRHGFFDLARFAGTHVIGIDVRPSERCSAR